ncbi:MarR family transcriptional regulator [Clostridium sp. MSJ-8]|uniref:MarR family winged helix-turn-helix transcriptional regulator n=1 Tax=Clostridium sp. MSJ-8 TaxID=2841510 RepID=UPI001C0EFEF3|nr:MarR family transcriptional regulator [Clostridium sp. MSJ-8]MBU5488526.1 MarR family transcriptional regulator [Clostridium sp. MSJ-8]
MNNEPEELKKIFHHIGKLHYSISQKYLDKLGIHRGQAALLQVLNKKDGIAQKDICKGLLVAPATVTVMLQRMEKSELITREQDDKDKRKSRIYLSEKGKKMCEEINKLYLNIEKVSFENLDEQELNDLTRLMLQVKNNLQEALNKNEI